MDFGTIDIHELKQISRDADNYRGLNADMITTLFLKEKKYRKEKFVYRRTAGTYFGTAGPGKNYRYFGRTSTFPRQTLRSG